MRFSSKPISSPAGLGEKFPPPLMRSVRTKEGSRSRGRYRSSPMFARKKHGDPAADAAREPSSPKVTCFGQVRVKNSKQKPQTRPPRSPPACAAVTRRRWERCLRIRNAVFCHHSTTGELKPRSFKPGWNKLGRWFQVGRRRKVESSEDSINVESNPEGPEEEEEEDEEEAGRVWEDNKKEEISRISISSSCCTPPKNAFLLTRSRSAPYRCSSLANIFSNFEQQEHRTADENRTTHSEKAESEAEPTRGVQETVKFSRFLDGFAVSDERGKTPMASTNTCTELKTGDEQEHKAEERNKEGHGESSDPEMEAAASCRNQENVKNAGVFEDFEEQGRRGTPKLTTIKEWKTGDEEESPVPPTPLNLKRCKSAPPKRFQKVRVRKDSPPLWCTWRREFDIWSSSNNKTVVLSVPRTIMLLWLSSMTLLQLQLFVFRMRLSLFLSTTFFCIILFHVRITWIYKRS